MDLLQLIEALWRKRLFLALFAGVPALLFGLWIFLSPRAHRARLIYPMELTATDFQRLADRFYGGDNLRQLIADMEAKGLKDWPESLRLAETRAELSKQIALQITPNYVDFNERANLKLSLDRSWAENVEKIEQLRARMLEIHLFGGSADELAAALAVVRHNFEAELPLRELQDGLLQRRYTLNNQLVANEQERAYKADELLTATRTRDSLAAADGGRSLSGAPAVTLQLDEKERESDHLPLSLQREIYAAQVALLSERVEAAKRQYALKRLEAELVGEVSTALDQLIEAGGDLEGYLALLKKARENHPPECYDLLDGMAHLADNYHFTRRPLVAAPRVLPQPRHTVQRTLFAAVLLAMIGALLVVVQEARLKLRDP